MERFDVAIVGAGPAGSTAAYRLAEAGLRVVLLEKEVIPRYKTCGGGVVGRARRHLAVAVDSAVEHRCRRAEVHLLDAGIGAACAQPAPIVEMTMRSALDAVLAEGAARAGAALRAPVHLTALEPDGACVTLRTTAGPLLAGFVVAADGATGLAARAAGWPPNPAMVPALECEIAVPERTLDRFQNVARFDFGSVPHGYAWVFPKGDHLSVGVLTTRRGRAGLEACLADYLRRVGITETRSVERHGYVIPLRPVAAPFVRNRTVVVGDAAGLADPVTAEGISAAAESGALAARAIVSADGDERRVRRAYERGLAATLLPELRVGRFYARLAYNLPRVRALLVRRFGDRLVDALADVMTGTRSYRETFGGPLRFLRAAVRALP